MSNKIDIVEEDEISSVLDCFNENTNTSTDETNSSVGKEF